MSIMECVPTKKGADEQNRRHFASIAPVRSHFASTTTTCYHDLTLHATFITGLPRGTSEERGAAAPPDIGSEPVPYPAEEKGGAQRST